MTEQQRKRYRELVEKINKSNDENPAPITWEESQECQKLYALHLSETLNHEVLDNLIKKYCQ